MTDIFVSYSSRDRDRVRPLVEVLEAQGWSVWWDREIVTGTDFSRSIEAAIEEARCVLVVWSRDSVGSHWVREEAAVGRDRGALFPVALDDVELPMGFRSFQAVSLAGWSGGQPNEAVRKLVVDLREQLEGSGEEPSTSSGRTSSWPRVIAGAPPLRGLGRRRWLLPATALAAVVMTAAALAAWWLGWFEPVEPAVVPLGSSVGVLPFENATGRLELDYLGPGFASGVTTRLAELPGISVVSPARAWAALEEVSSDEALVETLGLSVLIKGRIEQASEEEGYEVELEVYDDPRERPLWTRSFRSGTDLYALQGTIVRATAQVLSVPLSFADRRRLSRGGPSSDAFDEYLQGLERLEASTNAQRLHLAEDHFRSAIAKQPDVAIFHAALSNTITTRVVHDHPDASVAEAELEAQRALDLDSELGEAQLALARALRKTGRYAESISGLRRLLAVHRKPDEAFRELSYSYRLAGDLAAAEACLDEATRLGPENWYNWNAAGVFKAGMYDEAGSLAALSRAVELVPAGLHWPLLNRGAAKLRFGDFVGALEDFEHAGGATADPVLLSNIGTVYFSLGHFEKALELYDSAIERDPDEARAHGNRGDALIRLDRSSEATAAYETAWSHVEAELAGRPRDATYRRWRAFYVAKAGRCEKALGWLHEVQALQLDDAQAQVEIAGGYALCGDLHRAIVAAERAVGLGVTCELLRQQFELESLFRSEAPSWTCYDY